MTVALQSCPMLYHVYARTLNSSIRLFTTQSPHSRTNLSVYPLLTGAWRLLHGSQAVAARLQPLALMATTLSAKNSHPHSFRVRRLDAIFRRSSAHHLKKLPPYPCPPQLSPRSCRCRLCVISPQAPCDNVQDYTETAHCTCPMRQVSRDPTPREYTRTSEIHTATPAPKHGPQ